MKASNQEFLNRSNFIEELKQDITWDILIIGGGATGLGTALDSASRGYKTLLLEQSDFSKGTSSRSTKLVHGGVRYLAQGNIALVYEALRERGLLLKNAPHLVKRQAFIIPCYTRYSLVKYFIGLKIYDWLSGGYSFGQSKLLRREKVLQRIPEIKKEGLKGGVEYWDGQFDDSRLAVNIAQTAAQKGATLLNYIKVKGLSKDSKGKINGVIAHDLESEQEYHIRSKVVINATGVFVDEILQMDISFRKALIQPSQGVHIVLDKLFLGGDRAILIPETSDGRVLFAVPWHDYVLVGTTDTALEKLSLEPKALDKEIDFILETAGRYLSHKPARKDVLSVFAGLRPLAVPAAASGNTKDISRSHKLLVSNSGLITITGGKWTTYRKMAEDTVDEAIKTAQLNPVACSSESLRIHGATTRISLCHLAIYGTDQEGIEDLIRATSELGTKLLPGMPYLCAEVVWAVKNEMARTVEDVLARRLRVLFLDAKAAITMSPVVARLMSAELGFGKEWEYEQIESFKALAANYLIESGKPDFEKSLS
ncbi:glycerol-3-phosphate dehydrogenase/oxidase [Pedobacter sp. P351]|uniref:glycerol-3-phosphate dehydrogenase/oxidase n=1 Tax=Pedobacter superstes TaxID=3133441 RepID=UPI0030A8F8D4